MIVLIKRLLARTIRLYVRSRTNLRVSRWDFARNDTENNWCFTVPLAYVKEDHGKALYCVSFCHVAEMYDQVFAAAGGNRVR